MRSAAVLFVGVLVVACTTPASVSPSPILVPSPTPTAPAASPPSASPSAGVVLKASRVAVPADPHYIVSWSHRLLLLDPTAKTASEVATFDTTAHSQALFGTVSSSRDGRTVLVTAGPTGTEQSLFVIRPETAEAQRVAEGLTLAAARLSPDGTRFAIARNDPDPSRHGLWVGSVADRSLRRLIADDPASSIAPLPLAFSPDGGTLVFAVGLAVGMRAGFVSMQAPELRVDRTAEPTVAGATMLGRATSAEFVSPGEVFLWNSHLSGVTVAYIYDIARKATTQLYQAPDGVLMEAAWRPGAEAFATLERPFVGAANPPGTAWLRGRSGAPRNLGDPGAFVGGIWWSRDGSRLYATRGGDDSTGGVVDLLDPSFGFGFCLRGGTPGRCT